VDGHSSNFIFQALVHSHAPDVAAQLGPFTAPRDRVWIPLDWPGQIDEQGSLILVDGAWAWVYESTGYCRKVDAKEYDPSLKPQFEAARKQAKAELIRKGISEADSGYFLDEEMRRILRTRYQIDWKTSQQADY
jgi:hypothetical protein